MKRLRGHIARAAACYLPAATLLGLAALLALPGLVLAEDEDTSASVYLVFDPDTGEFITQDHPDAALPHQTGLEASGLHEADATADAQPGSSELSATTMTVVIAASAVLLGGGFLLMRRSRRNAA